ncbi:PREDICTED: F-box protein CPR30-like [Nelumbo nucifera]|uniref:F-box protein CPR30-like n=2 Tax=Nelumbo nucifera TaxID=4432 RepID=A0A1U8B1H2_NELNU|nr:PREDICTED: F-box protein CPR30-like [Nelumbo nucifera]DAD18309.1 TPA_asm: hypothetical protein HUJ06_019772 [Nelumbo nucifera]
MASIIPEEIMVDILSRLPAKSLLRFRCVCKSWYTLLHRPSFIQIHLNRAVETENDRKIILTCSGTRSLYSVDYDACDKAVLLKHPLGKSVVELLGSCNGLLCTKASDTGDMFIWNPSTGEYNIVPKTDTKPWNDSEVWRLAVFGFAFDPMIHDYKLVKIVSIYKADIHFCESEVEVYTLGSNSWRRIPHIPFKIFGYYAGVLVNGALHWMASNGSSELIASFDAITEECREIPKPQSASEQLFNLGVLGGCLCVSTAHGVGVMIELWMMKDYGVGESWTKIFTILQPMRTTPLRYLKPLGYMKNDEILVERGDGKLVLYNPIAATIRDLCIQGISATWFNTEILVGSLVSLYTQNGVDGQQQA